MLERVLITGGNGFLGNALAKGTIASGYFVRISSRQKMTSKEVLLEYHQVGNLDGTTDWVAALQGVDVVVHCAGRAHVLYETSKDPLAFFRIVNLDGTINLARQAVKAGVNRFVFISSIAVNGLQTAVGKSFSEADQPKPYNAYAFSKSESEQGLMEIAAETGLEVVIIRPPLVYGPNAPGNFGLLMRAMRNGWPLPLGAVNNQRSLVGIDNLVDFIITCINHPQAANQTFLVSDGQDLSTTELVQGMAKAGGMAARLLPVPNWALQTGASLLGKGDAVQRLCNNLQIDISKARSLLSWVPPVSVEEGLRRAMAA
jgi:nucleoside-diphosphate-sugar epimerase